MRTPAIAVWAVLAAVAPARAADEWTRIVSPNFELYTAAGAREGRDLVSRFEQVRSFFMKAAPVRPPEEFPVRVIAFRTRDEFQVYAPNRSSAAFFTSNPWRDYI